jgi:hypothetical protein
MLYIFTITNCFLTTTSLFQYENKLPYLNSEIACLFQFWFMLSYLQSHSMGSFGSCYLIYSPIQWDPLHYCICCISEVKTREMLLFFKNTEYSVTYQYKTFYTSVNVVSIVSNIILVPAIYDL